VAAAAGAWLSNSLAPMRVTISALLIALTLALSACGDDGDSSSSTSASVDGASTSAESACQAVDQPAPKTVKLQPPPQKAPPAGSSVTFDTSCGSFTVELDTKNAPKTSASFAYLAQKGVFDGTPFHRVAPGFVIQGGDPAGDGTGGPGYTVTERPAPDAEYTKGIVAMAKSPVEAPGTSGSQFFVVTGADAGLPPDYAIVGKVSQGFDAVKAIEAQARPGVADGTPAQPIVIDKATLDEG
jgi:peptidyl-prolyl cis-trans isomerase B (cyclophilin B)